MGETPLLVGNARQLLCSAIVSANDKTLNITTTAVTLSKPVGINTSSKDGIRATIVISMQ